MTNFWLIIGLWALLLMVAGPIVYFWYGKCVEKRLAKKYEYLGKFFRATGETLDQMKDKIPNLHKSEDDSQ